MACKRRVGPENSECQPSDSLEKGHLNFFKIILDSAIQEKKLVRINIRLINIMEALLLYSFGDKLPAVAGLSVANGGVWRVGLTKAENDIFFHHGWHEFVEYYSIREGHFLVFSYKGISNFHVFIFDKTSCEINYPFNGSSSEREPNHDKEDPELNDDKMEDDDDSIEILDFPISLRKRVSNNISRKQAMKKRYNPSSKQDYPRSTASMDRSKNGNGYETRSKKCRMEDQVEIIDLDNVNESSHGKISKHEMSSSHKQTANKNSKKLQAPVHNLSIQINGSNIKISCSCGDIHAQCNEDEHTKTAAEVGSANKKTKPCEHELSAKSEDDVEIIVSRHFSRYGTMSPDIERAIHAAILFKPKNPSFMVILRPYCKFTLCVPFAFAEKYLSRDSEFLTIQDSDGRVWPVEYKFRLANGLYLRKGWSEFSRDNNLKEVDVRVFELIKMINVVLKVSIFHVSTE